MDCCIRTALTCAVKNNDSSLVIGILTSLHNNKKIKTVSDIGELVEHAIYSSAVEENSSIMHTILKWNQVSFSFFVSICITIHNKKAKFTISFRVDWNSVTNCHDFLAKSSVKSILLLKRNHIVICKLISRNIFK